MATTLFYDNIPTADTCSHCPKKAHWWINRTTGSRDRRYNLCDEHFAVSLRKDAGLTNLKVTSSTEAVVR